MQSRRKTIEIIMKYISQRYLFLLMVFVFPSLLSSESQIRFITENDGYGGFADHYYTNGARLEFNTTAEEGNWNRAIFGGWNSIFATTNDDTKYLMGFSLGQEFYTPTNISKADISFGDRPYASRVYAGNSLTTWTENTAVTTELELGMIGPSVGGKTAQKNFHNYIGSPIPQGWDTQIPDSYSVGLRTDIRKFHHRFFGTQYNLNVGNIHVDASFGMIFRLGNVDRRPGPGSSVLQPGQPILKDSEKGYWYFYVNPGVTVKGHDATIQGAMGSDRKFTNGSRDSQFSDVDGFLQNPTVEGGYQELLYRRLVEDNGRNSFERFIIFNEFLVKNSNNPNDIGLNYLLFNNIFNGAEQVERGLQSFLINNLAGQWDNLTDRDKAVAIYSLFRPQGGRIPPLIRYYSYEILSQYILDPTQRILFLDLLRQNIDFTERKTYVADVKRAVGFIRAGFVSVSDNGFLFSINYNFTTIDFESARGFPQNHQWIGFQLGKVF
ncbi:MAG: lipid A deacylase LpxR family protein [Leptospira sp.]|nr:lipid A deacylase LpxR family protein [Leptospira sp.]